MFVTFSSTATINSIKYNPNVWSKLNDSKIFMYPDSQRTKCPKTQPVQWSDPKLNISGQRMVILSWWWCQYCPQRMYTRPRPDATAEIRRKCLKGGDRVLNWWCNDMERRFREGFSDFVSMLKKTECFFVSILWHFFHSSSGRRRRPRSINFPDCFKISLMSWKSIPRSSLIPY